MRVPREAPTLHLQKRWKWNTREDTKTKEIGTSGASSFIERTDEERSAGKKKGIAEKP